VPKQDWTYIYPDEPRPVGGSGMGEPEEQHDQAQAGEELQFRREHAMQQDMAGPPGPGERGRQPSKEPEEDDDEKFLEGFEEGYKLGKKVEAAEDNDQ
jgi:hypothetical protein